MVGWTTLRIALLIITSEQVVQVVSQTNRVILAGQSTTLSCSRSPAGQLYNTWKLHSDSSELIVEYGGVLPNYRDRFSNRCVNSRCSLIILKATVEDGGTYYCCRDPRRCYYSTFFVTVLGQLPYGEVEPQYVFEGENMTITCHIDYKGPSSPSVVWRNENGQQLLGSDIISEWTEVDNSSETGITFNIFSSSVSRVVEPGVQQLQPYRCTLHYSYYPWWHSVSYTPYSWYSPIVKVAYCPKDVRISQQHENFTVNGTLSCRSDSLPPATHSWEVVKGNGFQSNEDPNKFVVTSTGFFEIRCIARNTWNLWDDESCSFTGYKTGFVLPDGDGISIQSTDNVPTIVLGALLGVSVIVNIIVVIFIIIFVCKRADKSTSARNPSSVVRRAIRSIHPENAEEVYYESSYENTESPQQDTEIYQDIEVQTTETKARTDYRMPLPNPPDRSWPMK